MKKFTFLMSFILLLSWQGMTQILNEGFEGTFPPTTWVLDTVSGTATWVSNTGNNNSSVPNAHSGTLNAMFYSGNYNGDITKLVTPSMDLSVLPAYNLNFWYTQLDWGGDQDTLTIYYKTSAAGVWTYLASYTSSVGVWTPITINLPNLSNDYYIAFEGYSGYGYGITLDDVLVDAPPACPDPSTLNVTTITSSSANLGWTENGTATTWNIEWDTTGFTPGTGNLITGTTTNPHNLVSLTANTTYQFYVQADCGGSGTSTWVGPFAFTTAVVPGTCGIYSIDLVDTYGDGWNGGFIDIYVNGVLYAGGVTLANGTGPMTTQVPVNIGDVVSIDYTSGSFSTENEYYVYDQNATLIVSEGVGTTPNDVGNYTLPSGLTSCPTCPDPSALMATSITSSSANLGWTENGTATTWNIEWDTTGFTLGTGTMITGTTNNPEPVTGLAPETTYQFYVQADCGGDSSAWVGPFTFITPCVAILAPWLDDVETHAATTTLLNSNCWSATASAAFDWDISGTGTTPSTGTGPSVAYSGSKFFFVEASNGSAGNIASLMTPNIDLTALTTPALEFYYHMFGVAIGSLYVDVYNGSTWTTVDSLVGQQQITQAAAWMKRTVNLSAFSGTIQLRFRAIRGTSFEGDISIDNIEVKEAPSCLDPTNLIALIVNPTNALVSWTENGSATLWQVQWGVAGFPLGTGTIDTTSNNPYMVAPLMTETMYSFYVRAVCGAGDSSAWIGPLTFMTPCIAPVISSYPWTENFDGETVPNIPCGWLAENVNADAYTWGTSTLQSSSAPNALAVTYNATVATDDWAFTPNLTLTGGQAYQLSFKYRAENTTYPEKLKVMYGSAQNSASMTTMLFDSTNIINTTFNTASVIFTPATTASYFIGFHGYSDANMWRLYVDDVTVDISTNVNTEVGNKGFTVYPNPNHGLFTVATPKGEKATIEILNVQGKVIYKNTMNGSNQNIDLTNNAKGIYFVNITTAKGVEVQKIVIQ